MTSRRYALAAIVAAIAAASVVAVALSDSGSGPTPIGYAPNPNASAGTQPAAQALAAVQQQMGRTSVVSASITAPPAGPQRDARGSLPWLDATVAIPALRDGMEIESLWQADLIEGAVAEQSGTATDLAKDFGGSTFDGQLPDGSVVSDIGGGMGDIVRGQVFSGGTASTASITNKIDHVLRDHQLTPISVTVYRPLTAAPAIIASTSDPAAAAADYGSLLHDLIGSTPQYEGYYLELRDSSGQAFVRASASFRTGAGRFWVAPSLADSLVGEQSSSTFPAGS